uniref:Uncharacterized protein LOC111124774 isoform X2 n=1 Tax=Crassostrea virginica TaxID=6565 RepID=A0A8B8D7S2_CRAVI|nr:uncharacterized protein LOC111124774 isoform X2 [Crassostrea virginica]
MQVLYFVFYFVAVLGVKLDDFYPYGSHNGDTVMSKNDDGSSPYIPIPSLFPFYNHQHSKLTVKTNGQISFSTSYGDRTIAPFSADVDTTNGGNVSYRQTTDKELLHRATDEVRAYFPEFMKFRASWIFIATWDHVAFYRCFEEGCNKTNTFQAVLITNGQHSFTIYHYVDIQWTGTGNSTTGLGGTPAQVGFKGEADYYINASRTPDIVNVDEYSNVNIPGKFVFRVDEHYISDGGCNTKVNPADSEHRVYRRNSEEWYSCFHQINWDIDAAELQETDTVDIHLFSLMEDANDQLTWKKEIIDEGKQTSLGSANVHLPRVGSAMAIRVTPSITNKTLDESERGIWSDIFSLAENPDRALSLCKDWLEKEGKKPSLPSDDIQPCPCTLNHALLDVARFQPDPDCNMFNKNSSETCLYRRNATHCIRLSKAGPNGIDNLCCYDMENKLIDSRQAEGGFLQRYHYLGGDGTIPYLTNFYYDILPYHHCCRYSKNYVQESDVNTDVCYKFIEYRKPSSCVNYDPPRLAKTIGDPHIATFDGYRYTFNGVGEFVYLKTIDETFQSHIRFERFKKDTGALVAASVCTAFASQHFNSSGIIEVRLNSIRTAEVLIDGEILDFDELNSYQFPGVFVMQFTTNQSSKREFVVSFTEIGIAFRVEASPTVLNILPLVGNKSLAGRFRGLLGNFDAIPDNDLRTPSEEILLPNSTAERIYYKFGVPWRINQRESLFTYVDGKTYGKYQLRTFRPEFLLPSNIPPEVEQLFRDDQESIFDFIQTGSAEFAAKTLQFSIVYNASIEALNQYHLVTTEQQENNSCMGLREKDKEPSGAEDTITTTNVQQSEESTRFLSPTSKKTWIKADDVTRMQYEVLKEQKTKLEEETVYYRLMNKKLRREMGLLNNV